MTNNYILTLILKPTLEEKERKTFLDSIVAKLGKVEKTEEWGSRDLAYDIDHNKKGFYVHYEFTTDSAEIPNLDNILKLEEDIIRYLLIRE